MKKILFVAGVLTCMLTLNTETAYAQPVSLYTATRNAAAEFYSSIGRSVRIAVASMGADSVRMSNYLIDEMIIALAEAGRLTVADRSHIDLAVRELHFQTFQEIDETTAQLVGRFVDTQAVVTGTFEPTGDSFRFRVQVVEVESATVLGVYTANVQNDRIIDFLRGETPIYIQNYERRDPTRFWSVGISVGTAFTEPLLIGTLQVTLAPLRNSFIRIGSDLGLISDMEGVDYYSIAMFLHYAFFWPLPWSERGGWHIGAGSSFMMAEYRFHDHVVPRRILAVDFAAGLNIGNMLNISYTLRTNFSTVTTNIASVGFAYRFQPRGR